MPIGREEVAEIADEVRAEAVRFGRERDPEGTVLFEVLKDKKEGQEREREREREKGEWCGVFCRTSCLDRIASAAPSNA